MATDSKIEWTHHTFNPWWGCTKVSAACDHCYAETWARRIGIDVWGGKAPRRFMSEQYWREPYRWERDAARNNERRRVFCASMADVFEPRKDLEPWREELWKIIEGTPHLDWLLLTKRPHLIERMVPWSQEWPANVWLGTTVETQLWARKRLPHLLKHPAVVHFVSCEPLLGWLDLMPWLQPTHGPGINWVIAGGESGPGARPMNPAWAQSLRDQCLQTGTPFHFKQWGHWCPEVDQIHGNRMRVRVKDSNGRAITLVRLSKKDAGRALDGRVWDQFPAPRRMAAG